MLFHWFFNCFTIKTSIACFHWIRAMDCIIAITRYTYTSFAFLITSVHVLIPYPYNFSSHILLLLHPILLIRNIKICSIKIMNIPFLCYIFPIIPRHTAITPFTLYGYRRTRIRHFYSVFFATSSTRHKLFQYSTIILHTIPPSAAISPLRYYFLSA